MKYCVNCPERNIINALGESHHSGIKGAWPVRPRYKMSIIPDNYQLQGSELYNWVNRHWNNWGYGKLEYCTTNLKAGVRYFYTEKA